MIKSINMKTLLITAVVLCSLATNVNAGPPIVQCISTNGSGVIITVQNWSKTCPAGYRRLDWMQ